MQPTLTKRVRLTRLQKLSAIMKWKETPNITYNELAHWAQAHFDLPAKPNKSTI